MRDPLETARRIRAGGILMRDDNEGFCTQDWSEKSGLIEGYAE